MSTGVYGYWISKTDILEVPYESHAEIAIRDVLKREPELFVYDIMFRLGYVRVVYYSDNTYGVEYWKRAKLSKLQKEFIQDAYEIDVLDYHHNSFVWCKYGGMGRIN